MAEIQATTIKKAYETIFILRPDVDKATSEGLSARLKEVVAREDGTLTRVENWGRRKLAYPVKKQTRGVYVYLEFLGGGRLVSELERNLKLADSVLKFQTLKLDKEEVVSDVKDEDVEFQHVEPALDEEPEQSLAQRLGLAAPHFAGGRDGEEGDAKDGEAKADGEAKEGEAKADGEAKAEAKKEEAPAAEATAEAAPKKEEASE